MERSESWAPIYKYNKDSENAFKTPSEENSESLEEISDHIEKYIWNIESVFHEIVSDTVHIDVHWVKPTAERPFHTLVTSGMSDLPMTVPEWCEDDSYLELAICLPEEWKISDEDFKKDEANYWPLRWLKILALFPHKYNTWLWLGHTVPNGQPAMPFTENTILNTWTLLPSIVFDPEFRQLKLENKTINFLMLIPLCNEEVELKQKKWIDALFDGFEKYWVHDLLDVTRDSTIKRKKIFGLF